MGCSFYGLRLKILANLWLTVNNVVTINVFFNLFLRLTVKIVILYG